MIARRRFQFNGAHPMLVGSLFYWFNWGFIAVYDPFLNVYFSEMGITAFQIGLIITVVPLTSLIWAPFVSSMADRYGKRVQFLQWSMAAWVMMVGVVSLPKSFWAILPLVFLLSLMRSPAAPISDSMIAGMAVRHHLSYGRMRMWGSAGFTVFSILCGFWWARMGYGPMFIVAILFGIPAVYFGGKLESGPIVQSHVRGPLKELLRDPGMVTLFVISLIMGAALISTYIFGGMYMSAMGGSRFMIGIFFGLSALAEIPVMHFSGNIIDRFSSARTMVLSMIILTLSILGFALSPSPETLIFASMLKGVGFGLYFVTLVRLIDERAPDEWKSTAQAISGACFVGLSPLLTSALFGYIFDAWGGGMLYMAATMMAGTAVILICFALFKNWFAPLGTNQAPL
jgi:PPP family 3-phenylpropionic acid transporter